MTLEELKSAAFVVGMKETERAVEKQEAACVFIASDCDERISRPLMEACQSSGIPVEQGFTKKEIGRACGIKVKPLPLPFSNPGNIHRGYAPEDKL